MTSKTKTGDFLRGIKLPSQTKSYTVIPHGYIMDTVNQKLEENNFIITETLYKGSTCGNVGLGFIKIETLKDPDMSMSFNWINSYNKQLRFGCAIGGFIHDNKVPFVSSKKAANWNRKHTGNAFVQAEEIIESMIDNAHLHFQDIINMKEKFKNISVTSVEYAKLMGLLYFDKNLLSPEQASIISREYKKPSFNYGDKGSLWEVYKMLMYGIAEQHPAKWYNQQLEMNDYIEIMYAISKGNDNLITNEINEEDEFGRIAMPSTEINYSTTEDYLSAEEILEIEEENNVPEEKITLDCNEVVYEPISNDNELTQSSLETIANFFNTNHAGDLDADMMDEDVRYAANEIEETVLTEDELAHQLYGVDNNIEVSIALPNTNDLSDEEDNDFMTMLLETPDEEINTYLETEENEEIVIENAVKIEVLPVVEDLIVGEVVEVEEDKSSTDISNTQWPASILANIKQPGDKIINTIPMNDQTIYVLESGDFFIN